MTEVLLVLGDDLKRRGGAIFLLNWIQNAAHDKYNFTIFFLGKEIDSEFAEDFKKVSESILFGNIDLYSTDRFSRQKKTRSYVKALSVILKQKHFDIINIHGASLIYSAAGLCMASAKGIKKRISHAHTAAKTENPIKNLCYALLRLINRSLATNYVGVSKEAVSYFFGKSVESKAVIASARISTMDFAFSEVVREEYRKLLLIKQDFVIGHVGSFTKEKNHIFLIDVFHYLLLNNKNIKLLLIGTGQEELAVKEKVQQYGLGENVIFVGMTEKVNKYLCAIDCFVMPSQREGFPTVLLEAQASGLPCVVSKAVPEESNVSGLVYRMDLRDGVWAWVERINSIKVRSPEERSNSWQSVYNAGYDVAGFRDVINAIYN